MHQAPAAERSTDRRPGTIAGAAGALLALLVAVLVIVPTAEPSAAAEGAGSIVMLDRVELVRPDGEPAATSTRVLPFLDAEQRRVVVLGTGSLPGEQNAYFVDIDRLVQTAVIPFEWATPARFRDFNLKPQLLDVVDQRVFFGETGVAFEPGCLTDPVSVTPAIAQLVCGTVGTAGAALPAGNAAGAGSPVPKRIMAMSLTEREVGADGVATPRRQTFTMPPAYNGHDVLTMAHDIERRLLFVITQTAVVGESSPGVTEVVVHALDLRSFPDQDSTLLWSYPIRGCAHVLGGSFGSYLGVGTSGDFLYVGCQDAWGKAVSPVAKPTLHSAAVVDFGGRDARVRGAAAGFSTEHYPFPADLQYGFTFGDAAGDRVVVVGKTGSGDRAYVFDAAHRAWTGSVLVPKKRDANPTSKSGVVDPATGRSYLLDQKLGITASDLAPVPVLQGTEAIPVGVVFDATPPVIDPGTRRLFTTDADSDAGGTLVVFEDRTPPYLDPPPEDPDGETHDIEEEEASSVSYTGGGSAYGARALFVGGPAAAPGIQSIDSLNPWTHNTALGLTVDFSDLRPEGGDRGLFLGRVEKSQLTGGEASATATAASLDDATSADLEGKVGAPFTRVGQAPPEQLEWGSLKEEIGSLNEATCLDFGGEDDPRRDEQPGSQVSCSRGDEVKASATSSERMSELPVQVGFAASDVRLVRDDERGVVSLATAVARGVHIELEGAGSISIGEIRSRAETWAKGRPTKADSDHKTTISHVRVVGPDGEGFTCEEACDPKAVADAINDRLYLRVQAVPPRPATDPNVTGSPGGQRALMQKEHYAFWNDATINFDFQHEVAGLELVFYHDGKQASRTILQLAGVAAESQYKIGAPFEEEDLGPASLAIELLDDLGEPLAGGVFEVRVDPNGGDVVEPPTEDPDAEDPDAEDPDAEDPDAEDPDAEDPDAEDPDAEDPDAEDPDGEDPDGEDPDGKDPDDEDDFSAASAHDDDETTDDETTDDETTDDETTDDDLIGGDPLLDPLAGELIEDGVCVTGDDGTGDCTFDDIEPGAYVVVQTSAPAGYAPAAPFPVTVSPGFQTTVSFTNVRSIAGIEINLTDDGDPPTPLEAGEFVAYVDDGDLTLGDADVELGRCTTDAAGQCGFPEVPLGSFVVHQSVAPAGLMPADDVGFSLTDPGQVAVLGFVNGAPGTDPPPTAEGGSGGGTTSAGGGGGFTPPRTPSVSFRPPPPPPLPTVTQTPFDGADDRSGPVARMLGAPGEMVGFLARSPGEALLVMAVWLLLSAPVYLAVRRRQLNLVKDVA